MALSRSSAEVELAANAPAQARPPVLLTMAGYGGTLAAARCLGRAGIPVTVAADRRGQPATWSRWTRRRVHCPDFRDSQRFVDWLLEFGSREPQHVLYPTCDDLALLFAQHAKELGRWFLLYQPDADTVLTLLDKRSLGTAAVGAGLQTPLTYVPRDDAEVERIAAEAPFPLLIKPCTQVMLRTLNKGVRVERREDLLQAYRAYMRANTYLPALLATRPDVARPMLQQYYAEAEDNIHSVAGFVDRRGKLFVARGATKVLQQPRRVGVGLCFEDAPVDAVEARAIAALCRATGYFGVFEAEFIRAGDRRLLIDFNPRYYNQMGFEIARGLPLPLLVYFGALQDDAQLERAVRDSQRATDHRGMAWCHRFSLGLMIAAQRLSGRMSASEGRKWREWAARHRDRTVDAAFDREDLLPALIDAAMRLKAALRHPRAFFRAIVMNR
jgi:predicted ATP-grasp superfamily ATP-dependent carboligase